MNLYRFYYDIISAPSKEAAVVIEQKLSGEQSEDTPESIIELDGNVTLTMCKEDALPLPATAVVHKSEDDDWWFTATDTAKNWAAFWPNQLVASELN